MSQTLTDCSIDAEMKAQIFYWAFPSIQVLLRLESYVKLETFSDIRNVPSRLRELFIISCYLKSREYAIEQDIKRFESNCRYNSNGNLVAYYPTNEIVIRPDLNFGMPTLASTGIRTDVISDRFDAGDSIYQIAAQYHIPEHLVEAAILFEGGF